MEPYEIEQIEKLSPSNSELEQLWKSHQELDRQIREMEESGYGAERQAEIRALKKEKLAGKDRIIMILAEANSAS